MSSDARYENGRLTLTRTFNAPRTAVFEAWIQTSKVQLWWGCADATDVQSTIEPHVGGQYAHRMTLNNGRCYQHQGRITTYDPPALLAYELLDRFHKAPMQVRVQFIEQGTQTVVQLTQNKLPPTYSPFIMAGWSEGFEKLARFLQGAF